MSALLRRGPRWWRDYVGDYCGRRGEVVSARAVAVFVVSTLVNPCLHACLLIRLATRGPRPTRPLWRALLRAKQAIDVQPGAEIGVGLDLPHPYCISFGSGCRIGRGVIVTQHVVVEPRRGEARAVVGDRVLLFPHSTVRAGAHVGAGSAVGAHLVVEGDVPPGTIVGSRDRD